MIKINLNSKDKDERKKRGIKKIFSGVRFRILVWYFILAASTSTLSILITRQIFCDRIESQATQSLIAQITRFDRNFNQNNLTVAVDRFFDAYVSAPNESIFVIINGKIYRNSEKDSPKILELEPNLIKKWNNITEQQQGRIDTAKGPILYVAQPLGIDNNTVIVAVRDSTSEYTTGTEAIFLVIKVTLAVLIIFSLLAWMTAGKALYPLSEVTETARAITESDLDRRIAVKGNDEIAELSSTFNQMLDRLQSAFDCQQEFLKDASHELRTPITVIQGHLEILKYRPEKQSQTIALVLDELNRMNRLVNDLLLLAKSDRPDFLDPKPEELDWLTEEIYLKAKAIADRDWRLESKGLSPVVLDKGRLTQAIMNLVNNAVRHTKKGDKIVLGSAVKDSYAYFWVQDTGVGIAPEDRGVIFDRFTRATNEDRYIDGEGAGLGLAIVRGICSAHNGWVELDSVVGEGSTFTIVLPLDFTIADESDSHRRRQSQNYRVSRSRIASQRLRDHSR